MRQFSLPLLGRGLGLAVLLVPSWEVLARGVRYAEPGTIVGILDGANLIFHEAGHVLLSALGEFMMILGGSLMQVLIPAACTAYFLLRRQLASSAVTLFWTGESLTGVAIYVADAGRRELPLLGGEASTHDWNFLLGRLGLLGHADGLAWLLFGIAAATILAALGLLAGDLVRVWKQPEAE